MAINCGCCGEKLTVKALNTYAVGASGREIPGTHVCQVCGAVEGQCYKGDSYDLVLPYWAPAEVDPSEWVYFDLTVLGSAGVERRHGWFDRVSHKLTQVG